MDYLELFLWAFLVALAIRLVLAYSNFMLEQKLEEKQALIKKLNDVIHVVNEERHGEIIYWFDKDSDQFLAQGRNIEEISEHIRKRFHKHVFLLNESTILANSKESGQYELMPIGKLRHDLTKAI